MGVGSWELSQSTPDDPCRGEASEASARVVGSPLFWVLLVSASFAFPLVRSIEPGERWIWCYVDEADLAWLATPGRAAEEVGLAGFLAGAATLGFAGGLLHVLNHAFFKCQLFYAAGSVYQATHTVDMERLGGLSRLMPWTAASFLLGGVAISVTISAHP